jgi:hypothetical protein
VDRASRAGDRGGRDGERVRASPGEENMKNSDAKNLVGCCGLYCGLCAKYQSKAPSRCLGCRLGGQHSWCSIWVCCVKKHGFDTCAGCREMWTCAIFTRRKVAEWVPAADNLRQIKEGGLQNWLEEQKERQRLVEELLHNYNEGRSMSFYCKACARMSVELIASVLRESKDRLASERIDESDVKSKAKAMKAAIQDLASKGGIDLD